MANSSVILTSLDPNTLKQDFITFLQSQSIYKDAPFKGDNINVLLDLLSHNTFLNSFFLNMTATEMFADSAQLRDSEVSHAKSVNYQPQSALSAQATLNLTLETNGIPILEIPKGTQFAGTNSNGNFTFVTSENQIFTSANNYYSIPDLQVFEGIYFTETFLVDYTVENQRFVLSNQNVDTTSISVMVIGNGGSNQTIFTEAKTLFKLTPNSNVFFVQATYNNQYEVLFGDNVFGFKPVNGSTVVVNYRVCNADAPNGINTFVLSQDLGTFNGGSLTNTAITVVSPAAGGTPVEGIETIRFRAPRAWQTQDRAITPPDYEDIVLENFSYVKDVNVFPGGITNTAVTFGTVYIAAISQNNDVLTNVQKEEILSFIADKNVDIITPKIVDPTTLNLEISTNVHIDFTQTTLTPNQYTTLVKSNIITFDDTDLEKFNTTFRYSVFTEMINNLDDAILSNETYVKLMKTFSVALNSNVSLSFSYNNAIEPGIISSQFISNGSISYLTDLLPNSVSSNTLYLVSATSNSYSTVGKVSYGDGTVTMANLNISSLISTANLQFFAVPQNQDISGIMTDIIAIDTSSVKVNIVNG